MSDTAAPRRRRLVLLLVSLPVIAAGVGSAWLHGAGLRQTREAHDRAAASALAVARTPAAVAGTPGAPPVERRPTSAAPYAIARYSTTRRTSGDHPLAPATLPADWLRRLRAEDGPVTVRLADGTRAALAPLKDRDQWEIVGALLAVPSAPAPPRIPPAGLLAAIAAAALATIAAFAMRPGVPRVGRLAAGAVAVACAPALALWLTSTPGSGDRLRIAILCGTATVIVWIGLTLVSIASSPLRVREARTAWAFLLPSLAHLLLFSIGPIAFSLWLSFHRWNLVEPAHPYVGLGNYRELAGDAPFWHSVGNTAVYVLFVPIGMAVALGLALAMRRQSHAVRVLRTIFFLPYITSFVAISLVWKWMFEPDFGLLNTALERVGLPAQPWLSSPATALPSLMGMSVWMYAGYMMILFIGGLQNIPESYYESARIDGAGAWQRFRHITLPMLRPTTLFILVTMVIFMFQVFTAIYVMTEGGPLHSTDVIVYHIYRNAWEYLRMGYASAMAWVLFAVVFLVTLVQFRFLGGRTEA